MKKFVLLFIISCIAIERCDAQAVATAWGGVNMAQIDGDGAGNYNHLGYHAALNVAFPLGGADVFRLLVEVGLSEKGSTFTMQNGVKRDIDLLYVEVPIMLELNMFGDHLQIGAGVAPGVNVRAKVTDGKMIVDALAQNFKKFDYFPICFGGTLRIGEHWGVTARYQNSLLSISKENGSGTYRLIKSNKGTFNRTISLGLSVSF